MKWLPTPPTDNLYKYLAISGLWLTLGFSFLFVYSIKTAHSLEDYYQLSQWTYQNERNIEKFLKRIKSLEENKINDHKIERISEKYSPKEELIFLKKALKNTEKSHSENKEQLKELGQPELTWKWIDRAYIFIWLPAAIPLSLALSYIGFRLWYSKSQKYTDEILLIELELKKETLKQIRKPKWKKV